MWGFLLPSPVVIFVCISGDLITQIWDCGETGKLVKSQWKLIKGWRFFWISFHIPLLSELRLKRSSYFSVYFMILKKILEVSQLIYLKVQKKMLLSKLWRAFSWHKSLSYFAFIFDCWDFLSELIVCHLQNMFMR